jgi:hypothetical protein
MVKYKPKHNSSGGNTLSDMQRNLPFVMESKLCEKLNADNRITPSCNLHPNTDCIVRVSITTEAAKLSIESYCCEEFKPIIEHLLSQKTED